MKKTIAILLVAILAVGSAFAALTGSAQVGFGANFDNNQYGFIDKSSSVDVNFVLATDSGEAAGEGDIYASIKGSLTLEVFTADDYAKGDEGKDGSGFEGLIVGDWQDKYFIGLGASVDEATVGGENWHVSLLGVPDGPDFAKSAIDTYDKAVKKYDVVTDEDGATGNETWALPYVKAPGVEVGIYDYVIGAGFKAEAGDDPELNFFKNYGATLYVATPEYDFDGLTLQVAGAWSATNYLGTDKVFTNKDDGKAYNAVGGSLKLGFANDTLSASVAADLGYDIQNEEFGADVAANFTYDFVTVDAYYGTMTDKNHKNLLSAQVVTDLNSFEVPVKLTVTGKDLVNTQDLGLKAEFTVADVTLTPSVGYVIGTETFKAGLKVGYTHEYFTLAAETSVETGFEKANTTLKASASVENTTLIPGATLKLAWADANDLINAKNADNNNYGTVIASLEVKF